MTHTPNATNAVEAEAKPGCGVPKSVLVPTFFLTANGGVTTPRVCHAIFEPDFERACNEARAVAAALSKARYFNFYLSALVDGEIEELGYFRVSEPEPEAEYVAPRKR